MSSVRRLAGRRVVVVDDEASQAASLAMLLELEGLVATHEDVAAAALAHMSLSPPDALVVDVKMPGLSGTELVASLREHHPTLPAVFLTGYEEHDARLQAALASERVAYVPKPVDLQRLLDVLAGLLDEPTSGPLAVDASA